MTEKFPRFMYNLHKGVILDNGRELMPHEAMKLLNSFNDENEQLKNQNELLSDELEQCKAVVEKRWREYLKKKELEE